MIKFGAGGYERYGFAVLPDGQYNVYLFQLWTTNRNQNPQCVYKLGVTSAANPYDRLRYNAIADRVTISQVFQYGVLLATKKFPSKQAAMAFESDLLSRVPKKDFIIESKISGITEMRRWNQEEVDMLLSVINNS